MNAFEPVDPKLVDVVIPEDGYPEAMRQADLQAGVLQQACGAATRSFPKSLWIEPRDWETFARDNNKDIWGLNYVDRFTNQNPTHECTCHSLTRNAEAARNRQRGIIFPDGPKKNFRYQESKTSGSVWLSALSVYAEANPRQWGGANVQQVLEIACRRGFLPDKTQPREYGFKHTLQGTAGDGNSNQSRGSWVRLSDFPAGHEETSAWFRPEEVIFPESFEQAMCLLLHKFLVSVGRDGHAVPWGGINFASQVIPYIDSYDVIRYDSFARAKRAWQGSFCIVSMTTPDNWLEPAGKVAA